LVRSENIDHYTEVDIVDRLGKNREDIEKSWEELFTAFSANRHSNPAVNSW